MITVVGVAPDCRHTGVAVRRADQLRGWEVVSRTGGGGLPDPRYVEAVLEAVETALTEGDGYQAVAIPIVAPPDGWVRNAQGAMGTAGVTYALVAAYGCSTREDFVLLPPGAYGAGEHYPSELVDDGSGRPVRPARAAWDIATAAADWLTRHPTDRHAGVSTAASPQLTT